MNILPPKGMRDFLPKECMFRNEILSNIEKTYKKNGFLKIETPHIEDIENLLLKEANENSKLTFQILKRGEKLDKSLKSGSNLSDLALRFDLTLPLCRFYSRFHSNLPNVFKAFQTGMVFRAERPQKGRYRAFVQCDVDILGDESILSEIELITTMYKALMSVNLNKIKFFINDRRILKSMCANAGFNEANFNDIAITLDKVDKLSKLEITKELEQKGYELPKINSLYDLSTKTKSEGLHFAKSLHLEASDSLANIISAISKIEPNLEIVFDPTLVRGMGYYTSTVFEVKHSDFDSSIGGGGRYDGMIDKFISKQVPACGCSIGFERICDILLNNQDVNNTFKKDKLALFYKNTDDLIEVLKEAENFRKDFDTCIFKQKKKFNSQLDLVLENGFSHFVVFGKNINKLEKK